MGDGRENFFKAGSIPRAEELSGPPGHQTPSRTIYAAFASEMKKLSLVF